jgi:hypothetical protein
MATIRWSGEIAGLSPYRPGCVTAPIRAPVRVVQTSSRETSLDVRYAIVPFAEAEKAPNPSL